MFLTKQESKYAGPRVYRVILSKTATCATSARKRHVVELLGLRGLQHIAVQLETVVDKELYLFGSYCIPEVKTTIS